MKKILMIICCAFAVLSASAQDKKLTLNAGFLFPNTLNAMIGYEHPLSYGNAVEIYGEVGRTIGRNPPAADFGRVTIGMADWSISSDWYVTRTVRSASVSVPSSVPPRRSSSSVWKPALNTAMSFRTAGSFRCSRRTTSTSCMEIPSVTDSYWV